MISGINVSDLQDSFGFSLDQRKSFHDFVEKFLEQQKLPIDFCYYPVNSSKAQLFTNEAIDIDLPLQSNTDKEKDCYSSSDGNTYYCFIKLIKNGHLLIHYPQEIQYEVKHHINIFRKWGNYLDLIQASKSDTSISESKILEKLFETSLSPLVLVKNGLFRKVNQAFLDMTGYPEDEVIGRDGMSYIPDEDIDLVRHYLKKVGSGKTDKVHFIHKLSTKDQKPFRVLCNITRVTEAQHGLNGKLISLTNIEDYLETVSQLKESQNIFRSVVANAYSGIDAPEYMKTPTGFAPTKLNFRNSIMEYYLGSRDKFFASKKFFLHITPEFQDSGQRSADTYDELIKELFEKNIVKKEIKIIKASGEFGYFDIVHQIIELQDRNLIVRVFRDITNEKKQNLLFVEQKNTLDAILNATPDSIYAVNRDLEVIAINKQSRKEFKEYLGIDIEIGTNLREIISENTLQGWSERYFDKIFAGQDAHFIGEAKKLNGEKTFVENKYSAVYDSEDEIYACMELSRDITDLKQKELAIESSERKYKNLIETTPNGIVRSDKYGIITFVSKRAAEIHGLTPEEMVGEPFTTFLHPDTIKEGAETMELLLTQGQEIEATFRVFHSAGDMVFVEGRARFVPSNEDDQSVFLLSYFDVTERVKAEYHLNKTRDSFNILYKNTTNPIFLYDLTNDKFKMANAASSDLLGFTEDEFKKRGVLDLISPSMRDRKASLGVIQDIDNFIKQFLAGQKANFDAIILTKDEKELYCDMSILPIGENSTEAFIVLYDHTQQVLKNQELEKYIDSNLQLENFAYIASHDLKAPLRTIHSFANLLKKTSFEKLDEKGQSFLDIVLDNSRHMQILIDDLLEFSRVKTSDIRVSEVNLASIVNKVKSQLKTLISERSARLEVGELPETIRGDESMMIQLFQNLISNAIKFTKKDVEPEIQIRYKDVTNYHEFQIQDNGIGIEEKDQEAIFEIFKKLHNHDTYKGTGLGLTICKRIIENHRGKIWIESEPNVGSTFYYTIHKNL